jgi:transcriptional regulator with XRE-family HTH domain
MSLVGGSLVLYSVETARAALELLAEGKSFSEVSEATGLSMSQISRLRNGKTQAYYFLYIEYAARIAPPERIVPWKKLPEEEEEEKEADDGFRVTACRIWEQQNAFITPEEMYELSQRLTNRLMPMNPPDPTAYREERIEREIKLRIMSVEYCEVYDDENSDRVSLYETWKG